MTSSWVIREKVIGPVIMETYDRAKVDALNTVKYEAVPILEHLQQLNFAAKKLSDGSRRPRPSWTSVCDYFGLDTSFQYSDVQQAEYYRLMEQDAIRDDHHLAAQLFWNELLASVECLSGIGDLHGVQTLADLMYLQNAIATESFVDFEAGQSGLLLILNALPSKERWLRSVKIDYMSSAPS